MKSYEAGGFQVIYEDLVSLRSFLEDMTMGSGSTADDDESKDLSNRIKRSTYEAEYFINSYVAETIPDWCRSLWFSNFNQEVELIRSTFADISEKKTDNEINNDILASSKNLSRVQSLALLPTTDVVVGFEAEMELIKERLISDLRKLDVVSIVGMAGLGQTTFAKKVYEDPSIVDHFQLRAWCCVSQEYDRKGLLLMILGCMIELTDLIRRKSDGDLSVMLHKQLTGSRYLIVMDDIWKMDALRDLKRFFPDNSNGSRIMLTSRSRFEDYSNPLELRLLTPEESWDLFKQKVYHENEERPVELCQVGEEIAEKCRGLPLAIVLVAGILTKSEKKRDIWEEVARNLGLYITGDTTTHGQVMAVLELSYKHLPDHLKPLFLYLGAFPEDTEIPANKLTWLWISEGFMHKTDQLTFSLEVQAELNLMDLIDRSLVMIAERRSDGRVKSCRVHDLLPDMCLGKAKEENFMRQINSPDPITYERRLSITLDENTYRDHVAMLVHLRYIFIRTDWNSIPSSISKLWNLQTLTIKGLGGEILVPQEIWALVKLRHQHINYRANFSGALLHGSSSKLEKLQTLSTPIVCCGEEKKLIERVPNLRKLRLLSVEAKNSHGNFEYHLPQLESLDQLESLKILCHSRMRCMPGQFGLPSTLRKLTLSRFRLQWSEISSFGQKLPNLEVFKLRGGTFEAALWDMGDVEFSKLKFLKLESLDIKQWIVSPENFPCIKNLVLQSCKNLEELPSSVGDFYSLEKIKVV